MLQLINNNKAQAAVELAILGSIIILAFSALITLTEKVNRRQDLIQKVFRARLASAGKSGQAASEINTYYRAPNIIDPYAPGELVSLKDSGSVYWSGTGKTNPSTVTWSENKELEDITYTKKLIRQETPGQLPKAYHEVTYYDPIADKEVTRGEYAK